MNPKIIILSTKNTSQARLDNITEQFEILKNFDVELQIDCFNIGTANHIEALTKANNDGLIVLEDDSVISSKFENRFKETNFDSEGLYSFFTPKTRPQQFQAEIRKKITKIDFGEFYSLSTLISGVGYYIPSKANTIRMRKQAVLLKMIQEDGTPHKYLSRNADFTVGKLFRSVSNAPIQYFHPSILQHLNKGQESQIWNPENIRTLDRGAWVYEE